MPRASLRTVLGALIPVAIIAAFVAMLLGMLGYDIREAAGSAWNGAFGSPFAVFSATLKRATPLIILGVALAVAFRANVLNIGADGQFLAGAVGCVAAGANLPAALGAGPTIALELAVAALAGAAWAGIAAWLRARHDVNEVVSTLLLNFVALHLLGYLIRGPLQEPTGAYPQSVPLPPQAQLPLLIPGNRLHLGFLIGIGAAVIAEWYIRRTAGGFRIRVVGANPSASASAGRIAVTAVRARVLILSGALAGLAGASEVAGVTHSVYEGISPGYGYTAIAVALLGGLRPVMTMGAAVLFGALGAGADAMQRDAGVPAEISSVITAAIVLTVLAGPSVRGAIRAGATQKASAI